MPAIPIGRHNSEPMQVIHDGSMRMALLALLLNDLDHLRGRGERVTDFASKVQGLFPAWIA